MNSNGSNGDPTGQIVFMESYIVKTIQAHWSDGTYLSKKAVDVLLADGTEYKGQNLYGDFRVRVWCHRGWLLICRADVHRQVTTRICGGSDPLLYRDPIRYYRERCQYGAVAHQKHLIILDCLTDG